MARKHFNIYYDQICEQYEGLKQALEDMSKEAAEGMIEPERVEQLKQTIAPIHDSYKTLTYIKYLLDKPARTRKEARYNSAMKKTLAACQGRTQKEIIEENQRILDTMKL